MQFQIKGQRIEERIGKQYGIDISAGSLKHSLEEIMINCYFLVDMSKTKSSNKLEYNLNYCNSLHLFRNDVHPVIMLLHQASFPVEV